MSHMNPWAFRRLAGFREHNLGNAQFETDGQVVTRCRTSVDDEIGLGNKMQVSIRCIVLQLRTKSCYGLAILSQLQSFEPR